MTGDVFINNKDIYSLWGAGLIEGGLSALMTPARSKSFIENDSRILDGKQVLEMPIKYQDRDVTLTFYLRASGYAQFTSRLEGFMAELKSGTIELRTRYQPGIKYRLKYLSATQFSQVGGCLGKFQIKFNEPDPTNRS